MTSNSRQRRRPRASARDRTRIVLDWQRSGLSAAKYAAEHEVAASSLWKWASWLRTQRAEDGAKSPTNQAASFVEVPLPQRIQTESALVEQPGQLELLCPSGHVLRFRGGVSASALSVVLEALGGLD